MVIVREMLVILNSEKNRWVFVAFLNHRFVPVLGAFVPIRPTGFSSAITRIQSAGNCFSLFSKNEYQSSALAFTNHSRWGAAGLLFRLQHCAKSAATNFQYVGAEIGDLYRTAKNFFAVKTDTTASAPPGEGVRSTQTAVF